MRHGTTSRRQRNRGGSGSSGGSTNNTMRRSNNGSPPQRTQVYDSNGPDVRIRGTAYQVAEKYLALAKDATSAGDRIIAESYYQHAEHYIRIIGEFNGTFDASRMNRDVPGDSYDEQGNQRETIAVRITEKEDLSLPASILKPASQQNQTQAAPKQVEAVE